MGGELPIGVFIASNQPPLKARPMPVFKQIQPVKTRLADEIYRQILDAISCGDVGPNERLIQEKLAAELRVSRTPVREALLRLEQEGILEIIDRTGFIIRKLNPDEVHEIYHARAAIEGHAAHILAHTADAGCVARLRQLIAREENLNSRKTVDYFNANRAIHRAIVLESGNRYLLEMFDNIWNRGTSFHLFATLEKIDLSRSLGGHDALCDPIAAGDPLKAAETMRDHIQDGLALQMTALSDATA